MRIRGKCLDRPNQATATIVRAMPGADGDAAVERFDVLLTALPMGWLRLLRARGLADWPTPKKEYVKDDEGRPLFNKDNTAVTQDKTDDPKYQHALMKVGRRQRAVTLAEYLRCDENVTWEAKPPTNEASGEDAKKAWIDYAESLAAEIEASGLTDEEVQSLLDIGQKLGSRIDVEDRLKDFLSM